MGGRVLGVSGHIPRGKLTGDAAPSPNRAHICDDPAVAESLAGKLLVATPGLEDANFRRTVVFVCLHSAEGALGLVLNRPLPPAAIAEHVPAWERYVTPPVVVFVGGPVERTAALALALAHGDTPESGWTPLSDRIGLLDLGREPGEVGGSLAALRIFSGYAGWGAGQLDGEVEAGGWFVVDALPGDAFSAAPESLWREVLRRQPGQLAMFAHYPDDPSAN